MVKFHSTALILAAVLLVGIFLRIAHLSSQSISCTTCATIQCERKIPTNFLYPGAKPLPSVCVIGRSSFSHLPASLSTFSYSLLSQRNYSSVLQFIIGCEFNEAQEVALRDLVDHINCAVKVTAVFAVLRNESKRLPYLIKGLDDFCYIETDLLLDRLLLARTGDLQDGRLAWPALTSDYLPRDPTSPLCDYFLFSNTDNFYGSAMLTELAALMIFSQLVRQVIYVFFVTFDINY